MDRWEREDTGEGEAQAGAEGSQQPQDIGKAAPVGRQGPNRITFRTIWGDDTIFSRHRMQNAA